MDDFISRAAAIQMVKENSDMTPDEKAGVVARLQAIPAAYEDAEEQGRLVILPCKVGDAIFLIEHGNILEEKVLGFIEAGCGLIMNVTYRDYVARPKCENIWKLLDDDHLSVFLTREEAEKALEGMK